MNILLSLKEETRPLHDKLESELNLLRPDFSLDDYVEILKKFYGLYSPLEPRLNLSPERSKIPRLKNDLLFFGVQDFENLNICSRLPDVVDESGRFGIQYVLEGSTLGGQVLTKHFAEKFQMNEGLSFFSGYGSQTVPMWRSFQHDLLTFSESKSFISTHVIASANETFRLLNDWLIARN